MRRVTDLDLSIDDEHPLRIVLSTLKAAYETGDPRVPAIAVQALPRAARRAVERATSPSDRLSAFERSEEHTSELQSLMRISYAVFCLKKKKKTKLTRKQTTRKS